jgi:hypothetical protein
LSFFDSFIKKLDNLRSGRWQIMLLRKVITIWKQKFIFAWLVFCIGGIDSMAYADAFLPGHERASLFYHLSIFEEAGQVHNPLPPLSEAVSLTQPINALITSRFDTHPDFLMALQNIPHGAACFCHSCLTHSYVLTESYANHLNIPFLKQISTLALMGRSAWLSPPDKPPQRYFS